ncbi:MAG: insulinase family protein [Gammaproteobacteria bacterium]|nr:insulinase family protein [Gammaproteobacteria bacterium]
MPKTPPQHPAFARLRSEIIPSLGIDITEYRHLKTGAAHYHIASDSSENAFMVALRTVPTDSTGVAHILEHTVLCGSERYPVRDPFFMMIRRSLNTFMNALTGSDWTAYPFASQNKKDFNNLLEVYLDAVFFSRLDPLDFAQEGHRVEFAQPDDAATPLVFKGVVYNEMKGAMSSPTSVLWEALCRQLFPTTTYHHNSGGDPARIPDLSHPQLLDFYRIHYHPANAVFMTFGDIPVHEHHLRFENLALSRFDKLDRVISVPDEQRLAAPLQIEDRYAVDPADDNADKTHIVIGWLLGHSSDPEELLCAHLMSSVLLDNSASPLRHALETTELGSAPSPLCGLEDSNREMSFICGIEGSKPEHAAALEDLVFAVLRDVAERGVPQPQVEAVLHQLELSHREITGDGYPYGLHLMMSALPAAIHRGDPFAALNPDPILENLRQQINNPDFIKQLIRKHLLDNRHRIRLTMRPDTELGKIQTEQETQRLAEIKQGLTTQQSQQIIALAQRLAERQGKPDDAGILPTVTRADIPAVTTIAQGYRAPATGLPLTCYEQGTNGIAYQQIIIDLPPGDPQALFSTIYLSRMLTEVGCGQHSYLEMQTWQDRVSGGISAYTTIRGQIDDEQQVHGHFVLSGKALNRNHPALSELMYQTLLTARFDELPRLRELIAQDRARREQGITGHGHSLAMMAACSGMSPTAELSHRVRGLAGLQALKQLDDSLDDAGELETFAAGLAACHRIIRDAPRQFLVIGERSRIPAMEQDLQHLWPQQRPPAGARLSLPAARYPVQQMWITSTQVSFCARAYPAVAIEHPDAAALTVLGGFLRNGYLHRAIREQGGAYGGGAGYDSDSAAFRFYSYRDPRLVETLQDFSHAIDWLLSYKHDTQQLEEALLGVISGMDKPGSPAGEAKDAFHNTLYGRTPEQRQRFRARVLAVTLSDLHKVGERYLKADTASTAVITNQARLDGLGDLGMHVIRL